MDLFRVPEDKYQQNLDLLEKIGEKIQDQTKIATAVADILPLQHIGEIRSALSMQLSDIVIIQFKAQLQDWFKDTRHCSRV